MASISVHHNGEIVQPEVPTTVETTSYVHILCEDFQLSAYNSTDPFYTRYKSLWVSVDSQGNVAVKPFTTQNGKSYDLDQFNLFALGEFNIKYMVMFRDAEEKEIVYGRYEDLTAANGIAEMLGGYVVRVIP